MCVPSAFFSAATSSAQNCGSLAKSSRLAAASVLGDGFQVHGFTAALIGSLIYSLLGLVIESALGGLFLQK